MTGCWAATVQAVLPERLLLRLHVLDLLNCSATSQDKLEDVTIMFVLLQARNTVAPKVRDNCRQLQTGARNETATID